MTNLLFDQLNLLGNLSPSFEAALQKVWEISFKQLLLQRITFPFHRRWGGAGIDGAGAEVDEKNDSEDFLAEENIAN